MGGDFNIICDPEMDRWNPPPGEKPSKAAAKLEELKKQFDLIDSWRTLNPNIKRFTWRRTNPIQQSRLDYWLVSDTLMNRIQSCTIDLSFLSNHNVVKLCLVVDKELLRGRGIWKFNNTLLNDDEYVKLITQLITNLQPDLDIIEDDRLAWEYLKMCVRRETITYSVKRKKACDKHRKELVNELQCLEALMSESDANEDIVTRYNNTKNDLVTIDNEKLLGQMLRSKANWAEEGEKSSRYFLNLEKHNYEIKHLSNVLLDDGALVTKPSEVRDELLKFYTKLYTAPQRNNTADFSLFKPDIKLNELDKILLDAPITKNECKEALGELPKGKTPGSDGLTSEFYRAFWEVIADPFYKSLMYSVQKGELSIEQRRGLINIIPKGNKDVRKIKNWRPISVLNVDYKVIAKTLANRLKPVLTNLIHQDQTGYVQNRVIGENIRIVSDLMHCARTGLINGTMMLIDFEKAFDSLSWDFLLYTLKSMGFGETFIHYIKLLYTNISSAVLNNGHCTNTFNPERGIRQGCPASANLFIMCAELLAVSIRNCESIRGINIGIHEYKILQFADDTLIITRDMTDIKKTLSIMQSYGDCSGLYVNKEKTELVNLSQHPHGCLPNPPKGLNWCTEGFKYLGVWFAHDIHIMEYKNYRHRIDKIKNLLRIWRQRDLSLRGKVTILRSLALSQLLYPMSLLECPFWAMEETNRLFFQFLWSGKPDRVKRSVVIRDIQNAGLKMVDIDSMARALKSRWACKLYFENDKKWCGIINNYFKNVTLKDFITSSYHEAFLPRLLPSFYTQCLIALAELYPREILETPAIRSQKLWFNKYLWRGNQPIFYKDWYAQEVKYVHQIVNPNGSMVDPNNFFRKYKLKNNSINTLKLLGLYDALPLLWKRHMKQDKEFNARLFTPEDDPMVVIKEVSRNLRFTNNKDVYWAFIDLKTSSGKLVDVAQHYWTNMFDINQEDLKRHYYIPYTCCRETKIQSLQFKIVHNTYPCGLKLKHWKIRPTSSCQDCTEVDNLQHHFYRCPDMRVFWSTIEKWWQHICPQCDCYFNNEYNILLGCIKKSCHRFQINYIILVAKWYLYRTKYLGAKCSATDFLRELKNKLNMEELIYRRNEKYHLYLDLWYEVHVQM